MRPDHRGADRDDWKRAVAALALIVAASFLLAGACARAEEETARTLIDRAGFARLDAAAKALDVDGLAETVDRVLSGESLTDMQTLRHGLKRLTASVGEGLLQALKAVAAPVATALILKMLLGRQETALALLCRLACASALARQCAEAVRAAGDVMTVTLKVADALTPVLSSALAIAGKGAASVMLTPSSALLCGVVSDVLARSCLPMCALCAAVNIADSLSEHYRLDRLFTLLRRLTVWGTGALMALVTAILMMNGQIASAQDAAAVRAARWTIKSAIPFVGSNLADSAGSLLQVATLAKSAIGTAGIVLAAGVSAGPLARLFINMMSLKLAASAIEPVADPGIVRLTGGFGDVAGMLLAVCAAGALINALLCGVCLGVFGGQ